MGERFTRWVVNHPWFVVITTLMLVIATGYGASHIKLNADYRAFFSKENPQLNAFEDLQREYNKTDNVLIAIVPQNDKVFSARILQLIEEMTADSWQIPYSRRVDSVTNYQHTHAEGDDLIVENLVEDAASLDAQIIADKERIALAEPVLAGNLLSHDGKATAVNITINLPGLHQASEVPEVANAVRDMVAEFQSRYPDVGFYLTGVTMTNNAFPEASTTDMKTVYPVMVLMILVFLILTLRGLWGTLATFIVVIFSSTVAIGSFGWPGPEVTPTTLSAPVMIMTLAIADCVHILMSYYHGLAKGMQKQAAMQESMRINSQPVFLTSLTTVIGFLTLNFSDAPPFHDLGNIVAIGVFAAYLLAVIFLPALMILLPGKKVAESYKENIWMTRLAKLVINHRDKMLYGMSVLIVTLVALVPLNKLDDTIVEYFDWSIDFRRDSEKINEVLTGIQNLNYNLKADGDFGIADPAYLAKIDEFANWLRAQEYVRHVSVFSDVMKRLNQNMHADDSEFYRIPDSRELAAQYMLLYELSLPYGLDLTNQVNTAKSASRVNVQIDKISAQQLIALDKKIVTWLKQNAPAHMVTDGASVNIMFAHITERNVKSMVGGTVIALVLISLCILVAIRSVKLGLISLIPNLVPAGMGFGLWALFDGEVGLGLSVVMGVTLGIVVDDTIHFMSKYVRARRELNLNPEQAVTYAFHTVGVALVATTLVLCVGFCVLMLSPFAINAELGFMSSLTIALALLVDFFFLPPLLLKLEK